MVGVSKFKLNLVSTETLHAFSLKCNDNICGIPNATTIMLVMLCKTKNLLVKNIMRALFPPNCFMTKTRHTRPKNVMQPTFLYKEKKM